jgi:hypothetical protein
MEHLSPIAPVIALLALAGCATQQDIVQSREHLLAAAGFRIHPAATTEEQHELASLPPHQLVWQQRDGKLAFIFADPLVCHCVFVGDEQAYQAYRRMEFEQQVAQTYWEAGQMNENAAAWGPWGPSGYWWW